jgi:DNA adenine methylase
MPREFAHYYEPFFGGGALFFSIAHPGERCRLNDTNHHLMAAYEAVRDSTDELMERLRARAQDVSKEAYLALRAEQHPESVLDRAERMITLNRLGFQGLWRENSRGLMNTPYGYLANPTVCDEPVLTADSARLAGTRLTCGSYVDAVADAKAGDFVYFDPPYIPLSATSNFAAYAKEGFGPAEQQRLADLIADLAGRGVNVMLSNSDTPLTREIFGQMDLHTVNVHRSISAKASSRGTITEVLGVTYPLEEMADSAALLQLTV